MMRNSWTRNWARIQRAGRHSLIFPNLCHYRIPTFTAHVHCSYFDIIKSNCLGYCMTVNLEFDHVPSLSCSGPPLMLPLCWLHCKAFHHRFSICGELLCVWFFNVLPPRQICRAFIVQVCWRVQWCWYHSKLSSRMHWGKIRTFWVSAPERLHWKDTLEASVQKGPWEGWGVQDSWLNI